MDTADQGIATLSIIPGRSEPSHRSEMSQQILFGEPYRIIEEEKEWIKVRTAHDDYPCWIERKQASPIARERYEQLAASGKRILEPAFEARNEHGEKLRLVAGSILYEAALPPVSVSLEQEVSHGPLKRDGAAVVGTAMNHLGTPYLWGGRTPFGADCSGFVQTVLLLHGVFIQRDASDQVEQGESLSSLEEVRAGDLGFFHNEKGKVVHVGILTGDGRILHASGRVRIDRIDEQGIFSIEQGDHTHHLHLVKRVL